MDVFYRKEDIEQHLADASLISTSDYRRTKQMEYNEKHGITATTVRRAVQESLHTILRGREIAASVIQEAGGDFNLTELLRELEEEMQTASANLEFERAALLRDQIMEVKNGTGLTKIEPKRKPVKYSRGGASGVVQGCNHSFGLPVFSS
jgi:excinuclease ABC subunit B